MNNLIVITAAMFALMAGCGKENTNVNKDPSMVASKTQVKPGESVSFKIENPVAGAVSKWSVVPNTNVELTRTVSWNQSNAVIFKTEGNYTVIVEIRKVWCDSVAASHPGMDTCINSGTPAGNYSTVIQVKN